MFVVSLLCTSFPFFLLQVMQLIVNILGLYPNTVDTISHRYNIIA